MRTGHRLKPALARRTLRALGALTLAAGLIPALAGSATAEGPVWVGDYQTGDLGQWSQTHAARSDAITVVSSPARDGYASSARFTVRPGDRVFGQRDAERAEVMTTVEATGAVEGAETWHAWSSLFPAGTSTQRGGWMLFTQWHQTANSCPPNVAFFITDDATPRIRLSVRGGWLNRTTCATGYSSVHDLGPLPIDRWADFTVHGRWSADPQRGMLEVKLDGRTVLAPTPVANLYQGQAAYLKQGVYRGNMDRTTTIYHTGTTRGTSEGQVALRGAGAARPATATAIATGVTVGTEARQLTGRNVPRTTDALVLFDRTSGQTRSPVNRYGFEAVVVAGRVVAISDATTGTWIPEGGAVLSGHGAARDWLRQHAQVGARVQLPASSTSSDPS